MGWRSLPTYDLSNIFGAECFDHLLDFSGYHMYNFLQKKAGKIMISQTSHEVALRTWVKEEILFHEGFLICY